MEARRNLEEKLIETASAKEAVLYANTAAYLYDRLKKDTSVSYVAHELSTEEILRWLKEKTAKAPESPLEMVRIYIFLVGLSLKNDLNDYRGEFDALDLRGIEWAEQIRQLIRNEMVPTTFSKIVYQNTGNATISTSTPSGHSSGIVLVPSKDFQ
jgi:hypothetical protein